MMLFGEHSRNNTLRDSVLKNCLLHSIKSTHPATVKGRSGGREGGGRGRWREVVRGFGTGGVDFLGWDG